MKFISNAAVTPGIARVLICCSCLILSWLQSIPAQECKGGACQFLQKYEALKRASDNGPLEFAELRRMGADTIKEVKRLIDIPTRDWGKPTVEDFLSGVTVYEKHFPEYNNSGAPVYRAEVIKQGITPFQVFRGLGPEANKVVDYNKDYDFFRVLLTIDGLYRVIWQQVTLKAGFALPSRDAIVLQGWEFDGKAFYFGYKSIDWPQQPPAPGTTRIISKPSGFGIYPHPGGVRVISIGNADLRPSAQSPQEFLTLFSRFNLIGFLEKFFNHIQNPSDNDLV